MDAHAWRTHTGDDVRVGDDAPGDDDPAAALLAAVAGRRDAGDLDDRRRRPRRRPRDAVTAGSGGATGAIGSASTPSKTRGKPSRSSTARNPAKSWVVCAGPTRSMVRSTRDSPMALASGAGAPPRSAPATNHTRTETATHDGDRAEDGVDDLGRLEPAACERSRAPAETASACPTEARRRPRDQQDGCAQDVVARGRSTAAAACGSSHIASAPPVRNPTSDSTLTTSPCRYPVTA